MQLVKGLVTLDMYSSFCTSGVDPGFSKGRGEWGRGTNDGTLQYSNEWPCDHSEGEGAGGEFVQNLLPHD